jgi:hypothetical protein
MALAKVTEEDPFTGLPETASSAPFPAICIFTSTMSTRSPGRSALSGRAAARPPRWPPTRASPTPTAAALTPPRAARSWPTRAALWAATAPATPASPLLRWPWTPTARCSATAGGAARAAGRSRIARVHRQGSARRTMRRLGARARFPRSACPSSLRRRWRAR